MTDKNKEKPTMKDLRETAEELLAAGINNKEQLAAALPTLIALQGAVKSTASNLKKSREAVGKLSDACAKYAVAHEKYVFGEACVKMPDGELRGDFAADDGRIYHLTHGVDGYCRTDPCEWATQEFLESLPEGWARSKLELSTTGINSLKVSDEKLSEYGLMHKEKNIWSELNA